MEENNPDFVTVLACVNPQRALVVVMHFIPHMDAYMIERCSDALSIRAATVLSAEWAVDFKLELR